MKIPDEQIQNMELLAHSLVGTMMAGPKTALLHLLAEREELIERRPITQCKIHGESVAITVANDTHCAFCLLARVEYADEEIERLRGLIPHVGARIALKELEGLVEELTDEDPCQYDHHGYCQAHSLHPRPCPHERAKAYFRAILDAGKVNP